MSQWAIDPELSERRLATLVRLLEDEASVQAKGQRSKPGELDANEMRQWAKQCRNIMRGPTTRKPIEQMTDEELLS